MSTTKSLHGLWASRFSELQEWVSAQGRLPQNTKSATDSERRLNSWVVSQRVRFKLGTLSALQVDSLLTIDGLLGVQLTPRQAALKDWVDTHNRKPSPGSRDPVESAFGRYIYSLRSYALSGHLRSPAVQLLMDVPGALSRDEATLALSKLTVAPEARVTTKAPVAAGDRSLEARWNRGFTDLCGWVESKGELPNRRSTEATEYRIACWLSVQRMQVRKGNLLPEYEAKLRTVRGALEPQARQLSDVVHAGRLAAFHAQHGRLPRPRVKDESNAFYSLFKLRKLTYAGEISAEASTVLETVPGAARTTPDRQVRTVDERLSQVGEYLSKHGHLPPGNTGGLRRWIWMARRGKASVNAEKAERARVAVGKLIEGYPEAPRTKRSQRS